MGAASSTNGTSRPSCAITSTRMPGGAWPLAPCPLANSERVKMPQFVGCNARAHVAPMLGGLACLALMALWAKAGDNRAQTNGPRVIAGDPSEPEWDRGIIITVGSEKGDLVGATDRTIQAAVDYVA